MTTGRINQVSDPVILTGRGLDGTNPVTLGYRTDKAKNSAGAGQMTSTLHRLANAWYDYYGQSHRLLSRLSIRLTLRETLHVVFIVGPPFAGNLVSGEEEAAVNRSLPRLTRRNCSMLNRRRVLPLARSLHCCLHTIYLPHIARR